MDEDLSKKYSPSKLGTYQTCPRQYRYRYIDRIRKEERTVEAVLGVSVHEALEHLYEARLNGKLMTQEETLAAFEAAWARESQAPVTIHDKRYTIEDAKRAGRDCVTSYYAQHQPFDQGRTVAVEARVGFPLTLTDAGAGTSVDIRIEGFIDRLSIAPDGAFEIHDYKTSRHLPTQSDQDADWQLAIYQIAVEKNWPDAKAVRLVWHYLRHGKTIVSRRSPERLAALQGEIAALISTIKHDHAFEPVKSALCDWCDYRDLCPLFKHVELVAKLPKEDRVREPGHALVDRLAELELRRKKLRAQEAAIEGDEEQVKEQIAAFAAENGVTTVAGTDFTCDVAVKEEYKFPTKSQAPERLEQIESALKATAIWPQVSRLDSKPLMDGFKKKSWPAGVMLLIEGWIDKLVKHERTTTVRLHKKKQSEDDA